MEYENKEKSIMKVSIISIILNFLLSAIKLVSGIVASSTAMISDAIHSASDVVSTVIVMIGAKFSSKAPDKEHQYGHERIECIATLILSMILFVAGIEIGIQAFKKIFSGEELAIPGLFALVVAVISIIVKEAMFWYTKIIGEKVDSPALIADAWHHRSDALSSIGSFIGILGARLGFSVMDPIASLVICIFILKTGYDVFMDATKRLIDESCDEETEKKIIDIAQSQEGVIKIDKLKTRKFSSKIYVDLEISEDGSKTLEESHKVAESLHDKIEKEIKSVKHCMIHVNPYKA